MCHECLRVEERFLDSSTPHPEAFPLSARYAVTNVRGQCIYVAADRCNSFYGPAPTLARCCAAKLPKRAAMTGVGAFRSYSHSFTAAR